MNKTLFWLVFLLASWPARATLIVNNTTASPITIQGQAIAANGSFTVPAQNERLWTSDRVLAANVATGALTVGDGQVTFSGIAATNYLNQLQNVILNAPYTSSYMVNFDVAPSTLTSGTSYWSMRVSTTGNREFIRKIVMLGEFAGTAGLTSSKFGFFRFSGATPSGGTALLSNVEKTDSNFPASNLLDVQKNAAGLTMTGITVDGAPFFPYIILNQVGAEAPALFFGPPSQETDSIVLNPGEGLVIQAINALTAGVAIHGYIQFSERP